MTGTVINSLAVIIGGMAGMFLKQSMPERFKTIYFQAVGLFTLAIGITMIWNMGHILIVVGSLVIGSIVGEVLRLEERTDKMGEFVKSKLKTNDKRFKEGLVSSFLLFCVGSMTILGSVQEGLEGKADLLYTKSLMDFFSAILLASAFGSGVIVSALPLFLFQGSITLTAKYAGTFFNENSIQGISWIGGILLIGLAINILEIKKIKLINMLPSLIIITIAMWLLI